jgi:hypothetical protein
LSESYLFWSAGMAEQVDYWFNRRYGQSRRDVYLVRTETGWQVVGRQGRRRKQRSCALLRSRRRRAGDAATDAQHGAAGIRQLSGDDGLQDAAAVAERAAQVESLSGPAPVRVGGSAARRAPPTRRPWPALEEWPRPAWTPRLRGADGEGSLRPCLRRPAGGGSPSAEPGAAGRRSGKRLRATCRRQSDRSGVRIRRGCCQSRPARAGCDLATGSQPTLAW